MGKVIAFDEALAMAKKRNSNYNEVEEYTDAWYFYINDGNERMGGDTGIVIEKKGGKMLLPFMFFMDGDRKTASTGKVTEI